jgi:hypothetical protein
MIYATYTHWITFIGPTTKGQCFDFKKVFFAKNDAKMMQKMVLRLTLQKK